MLRRHINLNFTYLLIYVAFNKSTFTHVRNAPEVEMLFLRRFAVNSCFRSNISNSVVRNGAENVEKVSSLF